MEYVCSVCQQRIQGEPILLKEHTDKHIIDLLKHDHPEWVEDNGLCPRCAEYYRSEIAGSVFKDAPCALRIRKVKNLWAKVVGLLSH
jgi:hypothetical protein